jgi:hypothetical protein
MAIIFSLAYQSFPLWLASGHEQPGWKCLPRKNALAYFASVNDEKNFFRTLTKVVNILKLVFFLTDEEAE